MMRIYVPAVLLLLILTGWVPCYADALMSADQGIGYLPLKSTVATVNVNDQVVTTTIDHTFFLENETFPDLMYYFPLPDGASITALGMWFDDELYYYDLEPGLQGGGGGGDLPYDLQQYLGSNPFSQTFPEMEAGQVTVRLEYAELMRYDFGVYQFDYPLDHPDFYFCNVDSFHFEIYGESQRMIDQVNVSPYAADFTTMNDYEFACTIHGNGIPIANLHTNITVDQEDVGLWLMSYREVDTLDPGYFLAILEPGEVAPEEILQKNFTFVIDKSGSMGYEPMEEAKEAAIYCVTHLDEDDYFNIIAFDYYPISWMPNPVVASAENVASAVSYISSIYSGGGTNFNDAVLQALQQEAEPYRANQILVLSDGQPTVGVVSLPAILENIANANDIGASIFTVAAGSSASLDFLDYIALENSGLSHTVDDLENLAEEIELFFLRFASPVLTQVTLDYGPVETGEIYPIAPYTMFAGSQTLIAGQYASPNETTIDLSATVAGVDTTITYGPFNFTQGDTTSFSFVPRMWAIQKIDYWLAYMAVYGEEQEIVDMIVDLSLSYGILTEYTGFQTPVEEDASLTVSATRDKVAVYLSWTLQPAIPASYDVYRREVGGRAWLKLNREPLQGNHYIDRTAQSNITYEYRVVLVEGDVAVAPADIRVTANSSELIAGFMASPNPFNSSTHVNFTLARQSTVKLTLYDVLGREVMTLLNEKLNPGEHRTLLNGDRLASGSYFLHMTAEEVDNGELITQVSRVNLLK